MTEKMLLITREDLQKLLDRLPGERITVDLLLELRKVRTALQVPREGGEHPAEVHDAWFQDPVLRFSIGDGVQRCAERTCTHRIIKVKERPHPQGFGDPAYQVLDLSAPVFQVVRREDGSLECILTEDCFISHFSTCTNPNRFSGSAQHTHGVRSGSKEDPQRSLL